MTRDTYLVFDPEDRFHACICFGEAEAKEIIGHFACPTGLQVLRITMGEPVRDVTADLIPEDEPERFGGDYCHTDHFPALYHSVRAG